MAEIHNIFIESPNRETYEEYKSDIKNSLVFLKDEEKLIGNENEYQFVTQNMSNNISKIPELYNDVYNQELKVGDVVLVDNNTEEKIAIKADELENYKDTHTPIGVVVIPTSHDVYGTGEAAIVNFTYLSRTAPDTGTATPSNSPMLAVDQHHNFPSFNMAPGYDGSGAEVKPTLITPQGKGKLPTDRGFTGKKCPVASGFNYPPSMNADRNYCPNPYLEDGGRNPDYYDTTITTSANCLSDFDGEGNTKRMVDLSTSQSNWKTASSIDYNPSLTHYPAACCSWRFYTKGTKQGDWYIPSMGEFGYLMVRLNYINSVITKIKEIYPSLTIGTISGTEIYYTSTYAETGTYYGFRAVWMSDATVGDDVSNRTWDYLRVFTKVSNIKKSTYKTKFYTKEEINNNITEINSKLDDSTTELNNKIEDCHSKCEQAINESYSELNLDINKIKNTVYKLKDLEAGDIILVNNKTGEKIAVKSNELENYKDTYTPIGVVAIPTLHDVYGTKEAGVVSLAAMSLKSPETGVSNNTEYIPYGYNQTDLEIPNKNKVCSYGDQTTGFIGTLQTPGVEYFYLPSDSDSFTGQEYPAIEGVRYHTDANNYSPSPYNSDGSRNPDYYDTTISTVNNAFSDFDGLYNTKVLYENSTDYPNWKTEPSLVYDRRIEKYSPVGCVCWRFYTLGTEQGDWYLPAMGELGYLVAKYKTLDDSFNSIKEIYGDSVIISNIGEELYSSSTEASRTNKYLIHTKSGAVRNYLKEGSGPIKAFTRIKILDEITANFYTREEVDNMISNICITEEELNEILK